MGAPGARCKVPGGWDGRARCQVAGTGVKCTLAPFAFVLGQNARLVHSKSETRVGIPKELHWP